MRGLELAKAMAATVDRRVNAREGTGTLDRAIEVIVGTIGRFGGKNATSYLEAYRAEMVMRDIPEDRRLARFPRVATTGIHVEVLEVQAGCRTWEEFEGRLLKKYGLDDSLRLSKLDFMEWVETPGKRGTHRRSSGSLKNGLPGSRHSTRPCLTRAVSCCSSKH